MDDSIREELRINRIYIWLRAASIIEPERNVKFLIDTEDKVLFNLIRENNEWKKILNYEIGVNYSESDLIILEKKIAILENGTSSILEFPIMSKIDLDDIERAKQELNIKVEEKSKIDTMEFNRRIYEVPTNFSCKWLESIGIKINDTKLIGY